MTRGLDPALELRYNKYYIGLARNGQPDNFVVFRPKREFLRIEPRIERSDELQTRLDEAGLDVMDYDARWGRYRLRLSRSDIAKQKVLITELLSQAYGGTG